MIYNKEKIEQLVDKLTSKKITRTENVFYLLDKDLRKSNVPYVHNQDELIEYAKCYSSKKYFIESNFDIKLLDFQIEIIKMYDENRFNIFAKSPQIGFETLMSYIYLWEMVFKKSIAITYIDHKTASSMQMLKKIKENYKLLPFFLKPGIVKWNMKSIVFENNNRIMTETFSIEPAIGYKSHIVHFNDFAQIPHKKQEKVYGMYVPTITYYSDTKLIISSSFNGFDFFYKLMQDSDQGLNIYNSIRLPYNVVPLRGDEWRKNEIEILDGDEELFDMRYGMIFHVD